MQPFLATNLAKAVALSGGMLGLKCMYEQQHSLSFQVENNPQLPLQFSPLVNKYSPFPLEQVQMKYKSAMTSLDQRLLVKTSVVSNVMGAVRFDSSFMSRLLLSPSLTECDELSGAHSRPDMLSTAVASRPASETPNDGLHSTSYEKREEVVTAGAEKGICTVLLYDENSANDSIVLRGCHVLFSWSVFAGVWSSVIAFPLYTAWKVAGGAWTAVASIVTGWVCSLFVRLPSCHELRRFVCRGLHKWFPRVEIVYEEEPAVNRTIFCAHPHGVFSIGTALLLDDLNYRRLEDGSTRDVGIVAAPFLRWGNPVFKCIADLMGIHIHGAGRKEFRELLTAGSSFALVPGGFSEATITCVGKERVYIDDRKGFVKYALRAGYSLTPVYVFGESDLYYNPQGLMQQRLHLNTFRFQIPGVLPFGYPFAPFAPRRVPIRVVCGAALQLPVIENPSEEDVNFYHAKYVEALEALFYRHVEDYHQEVASKYGSAVEAAPRVLERW